MPASTRRSPAPHLPPSPPSHTRPRRARTTRRAAESPLPRLVVEAREVVRVHRDDVGVRVAPVVAQLHQGRVRGLRWIPGGGRGPQRGGWLGPAMGQGRGHRRGAWRRDEFAVCPKLEGLRQQTALASPRRLSHQGIALMGYEKALASSFQYSMPSFDFVATAQQKKGPGQR